MQGVFAVAGVVDDLNPGGPPDVLELAGAPRDREHPGPPDLELRDRDQTHGRHRSTGRDLVDLRTRVLLREVHRTIDEQMTRDRVLGVGELAAEDVAVAGSEVVGLADQVEVPAPQRVLAEDHGLLLHDRRPRERGREPRREDPYHRRPQHHDEPSHVVSLPWLFARRVSTAEWAIIPSGGATFNDPTRGAAIGSAAMPKTLLRVSAFAFLFALVGSSCGDDAPDWTPLPPLDYG